MVAERGPQIKDGVVIVEDDIDTLDLLKIIIQKDYPQLNDTDIVGVTNINDAERILEYRGETKPSLIILSVKLDGQDDGRDLLRKIRSDASYNSVPILMYSAYDKQTIGQECLDLGANAYIQKPSTLQEVRTVISEILTAQDGAN